ncbi:hypothetical protein E4T81_04975 [Barnesiella sp. WM24]|uniref:hypothetical protein n=1 Tax=Barnesiella sp. WM24 TaxID=2558278 RepID=UPI0010721800|nr:hypothetical protein [Barnesiella sp. WM24]TFU93948.1 hypothetical protein E4T81_04975 [Barnesiella sp. WM24]
MKTPTDRPQKARECEECKYYKHSDKCGLHAVIKEYKHSYGLAPARCRLFHGYHCPDFTPKTKEK